MSDMIIKDKNGETIAQFSTAHYGEERELNATDGEMEIAEHILQMFFESGINTDEFRLIRVSDSYLTLKYNCNDIARFKWSDRAKWIQLPYAADDSGKRYIESINEISEMRTLLLGHYFLAVGNKLLGY